MGEMSRGYRLWVGATTVSQIGDVALYLALGWAASAYGGAAVGLVLAAVTVPRTVLLLAGGAVVDRVGSRPVLLVTDGILLVGCAVAGGIVLVVGSPLWLLVTVALLLGTLTAFGFPAAAALPAVLVAPAALPRALALRHAGYQTASLVGGPVGGILLTAGGLALVLGVNAASFLAVVAVVLVLRPARAAAQRDPGTGGLRVVLGSPVLRRLVGVFALAAAVVFPVGSVLVPLLARERGWSAVDVGLVASAQGLGALLAAAVIARTGVHPRVGAAGLVLTAGAALGLVVAPSAVAAAGTGALLGVGLGAFIAHASPLIVRFSPATHLGRVQAVAGVGQSAALVVSNLALGALAGAAGAGTALVVGAAGLTLAAVLAARLGRLAEADGNRTRLAELLDHVGVEDRGGHQAP